MSLPQNEQSRLREAAEAKLVRARLTLVDPKPGEDLLHELLHELKVHQIELEMQNEELKNALIALEENRNRYFELYEFSPIGYITLAASGQIVEANLTVATFLGIDRSQLLNQRFDQFVSATDRERWRQLFITAMENEGWHSIALTLQHGDTPLIEMYVNCMHTGSGDSKSTLRIALTNLTSSI